MHCVHAGTNTWFFVNCLLNSPNLGSILVIIEICFMRSGHTGLILVFLESDYCCFFSLAWFECFPIEDYFRVMFSDFKMVYFASCLHLFKSVEIYLFTGRYVSYSKNHTITLVWFLVLNVKFVSLHTSNCLFVRILVCKNSEF